MSSGRKGRNPPSDRAVPYSTSAAASSSSSSSKGMENNKWWTSMKGQECPITLESLSDLPYPPFALLSKHSNKDKDKGTRNHGNGKSNKIMVADTVSYFDGLALASYIVSRGVFENPLTREELTMLDCRRLDDHLEEYCYNQKKNLPFNNNNINNDKDDNQNNNLSNLRQRISVAEAYGLRLSVQVEDAHHSRRNGQQNTERARALRNTATAALAGLFVFGRENTNNRTRNRHGRDGKRSDDETTATQPAVASLPPEDRLLLEWGFDLRKTVNDTSEYGAGDGWTVIDDDEALVVASQRQAYEATQNAFPHLPINEKNKDMTASEPAVDTHLLEKVAERSQKDEQEQMQKLRQRELAQQRLLQQTLERREQRKMERQRQRVEASIRWEERKQDKEELERVRAEIEAWKAERWDQLRAQSDAKKLEEENRLLQMKTTMQSSDEEKKIEAERLAAEQERKEEEEEEKEREAAAQKKAKAAAKRKRAKARKKAQKAEVQAKVVEQKKQQVLNEQKASSAVQCSLCGQGILDCGFEKYNQKFCSPKCARQAKKPS